MGAINAFIGFFGRVCFVSFVLSTGARLHASLHCLQVEL